MDAFFSEFSRFGRRMFILKDGVVSVSGRLNAKRFEESIPLDRIDHVERMSVWMPIHFLLPGVLACACGWGVYRMAKAEAVMDGPILVAFMFACIFSYHAVRGIPKVDVYRFIDRSGNVVFDLVRSRRQAAECDAFVEKLRGEEIGI